MTLIKGQQLFALRPLSLINAKWFNTYMVGEIGVLSPLPPPLYIENCMQLHTVCVLIQVWNVLVSTMSKYINNLGRVRNIKGHTNAADSLFKGLLGHTQIFLSCLL